MKSLSKLISATLIICLLLCAFPVFAVIEDNPNPEKDPVTGSTEQNTETIPDGAKYDLNCATAVLDCYSFDYDGTEKKPTATVTYHFEGNIDDDMDDIIDFDDMTQPATENPDVTEPATEFNSDVVLTQGVDYDLTYQNNIAVGTAAAIITGKNEYYGTISVEFEIVAAASTEPTNTYTEPAESETAPVIPTDPTESETVTDKPTEPVETQPVTDKPTEPVETQPVTDKPAEPTETQPVETQPAKTDISKWKVSGLKSKTYTGKALKQNGIVVSDGKTNADINVKYLNNINAGVASVLISGKGNFTGTITKTFKINKAANPIKVTAKKSLTAKSDKKTTIKNAVTVKNYKGKVTYSSNNKNVKIDKGNIKVAKGIKKGKTFKVKITVTAKGNDNYKSKKLVKTITIIIK